MYAIKWERKNHSLMTDASGYLINSCEVPQLNKIMIFETLEEAEENLKIAQQVATESMSFEIVQYPL